MEQTSEMAPQDEIAQDPAIAEIRKKIAEAQTELETRLKACSDQQRAVLRAVQERARQHRIEEARRTIQSLSTPPTTSL